jgi:hypothetical protein
LNLHVAVYRRTIPDRREWQRTLVAAVKNPLLALFMGQYLTPDRYYDWGDDPSFFGACETLQDPRLASWGVCRPDLRDDLRRGDVVAFFIFKPEFTMVGNAPVASRNATYYFVGCGTVDRLVTRDQVWTEDSLAPYRGFFNIVARPDPSGELHNVEVFPPHADWRRRVSVPMALFDPSLSAFDLRTPHLVSRYDPESGPPDVWYDDPISQEIERLLFGRTRRRLRTSATMHQHARFRAAAYGTDTRRIRAALLDVVNIR